MKDQKSDSESEQSSWDSGDNYESEEEVPAPRRSAVETVTARSTPAQQAPSVTRNSQATNIANGTQTYNTNSTVESNSNKYEGTMSEQDFNESAARNVNQYQEDMENDESEQYESENFENKNEDEDEDEDKDELNNDEEGNDDDEDGGDDNDDGNEYDD